MKLLQLPALLVFSLAASVAVADHHEMPKLNAEVHECTLKGNATLSDVLSFARSEFSDWAEKSSLNLRTFIWEPVAVAPPYDQADLRWVNYFPSWGDYAKANTAWRAPGSADLSAKLLDMVDCKLPAFAQTYMFNRADTPLDEKTILLGKCSFKPGLRLTPERLAATLKAQDREGRTTGDLVESFWITSIGIEGEPWDFLRVTGGSAEAIAEMMDSGNGPDLSRMMANPFSCETDFHRSHTVHW
jgi:hypothetical protein